jgi:hypothetical protein
MAYSGMLRRVVLVRTDVSQELSSSFIRVTRINELERTLVVTSNRPTLRRNTKWIYVVWNRDQWCALVNTAMKLVSIKS